MMKPLVQRIRLVSSAFDNPQPWFMEMLTDIALVVADEQVAYVDAGVEQADGVKFVATILILTNGLKITSVYVEPSAEGKAKGERVTRKLVVRARRALKRIDVSGSDSLSSSGFATQWPGNVSVTLHGEDYSIRLPFEPSAQRSSELQALIPSLLEDVRSS